METPSSSYQKRGPKSTNLVPDDLVIRILSSLLIFLIGSIAFNSSPESRRILICDRSFLRFQEQKIMKAFLPFMKMYVPGFEGPVFSEGCFKIVPGGFTHFKMPSKIIS